MFCDLICYLTILASYLLNIQIVSVRNKGSNSHFFRKHILMIIIPHNHNLAPFHHQFWTSVFLIDITGDCRWVLWKTHVCAIKAEWDKSIFLCINVLPSPMIINYWENRLCFADLIIILVSCFWIIAIDFNKQCC